MFINIRVVFDDVLKNDCVGGVDDVELMLKSC